MDANAKKLAEVFKAAAKKALKGLSDRPSKSTS
jgi:hypothetical protein